jgi:hypothetical protein
VRVDECRLATYICRVVWESPSWVLIGSNRRLLYGKRRLETRTIIVVNKWN